MAEEEEMKRRKEEMVNVFLKMKLNKEERNSGLNTSKLIDRYGYGPHLVRTLLFREESLRGSE